MPTLLASPSPMGLRFPSVRQEGVVTDPRYWESQAGYEFWLLGGSADVMTAAGAANDGLDAYGWTRTNPVGASFAGPDLLSSADRGDPEFFHSSTTAGDGIASPRIFGSYDHALQAARFLGQIPTKMVLEYSGRWSLTANELTAFAGMGVPTLADASAAGSAGCIRANNVNFTLTSDLAEDVGAAVDANWHTWRIEYGASLTEWFIDNVSQGTITTETDIWPVSFVYKRGASNNPRYAWVRVYYQI